MFRAFSVTHSVLVSVSPMVFQRLCTVRPRQFCVFGVGIRCGSDGVCQVPPRCGDLLEFSVIPVRGGSLELPRRLFSSYCRY
ncbi:hypothetical protein Bca101_025459 [Brassica carinata]